MSSSPSWTICLPGSAAAAASPLRLFPEAEVCTHDDLVWIRGSGEPAAVERALRLVIGAQRYTVGPGGQITRLGYRLPSGRLPEAGWVPLLQWLVPAFDTRAASTGESPRAGIRVVRGGIPVEAGLLITEVEAWTKYALSAPEIRLRKLAFAAGIDRRVAIRGRPLPPISGQLFYERQGVFAPCGYIWEPQIQGRFLREISGADTESQDAFILHEDGSCEIIQLVAFVAATRASVRMTRTRF